MRFLPFRKFWKRTDSETRNEPGPEPQFGEWLIDKFSGEKRAEELTFAETERACSNAGSLVCAAAFQDTARLAAQVRVTEEDAREAALIAQRTGDGFKAALEDREHTVVTWPWDHLATRIVWNAQREGDPDPRRLGRGLVAVGVAYAIGYREQLQNVLNFWQQVANGMKQPHGQEPPNLFAMSAKMLAAYEEERAA